MALIEMAHSSSLPQQFEFYNRFHSNGLTSSGKTANKESANSLSASDWVIDPNLEYYYHLRLQHLLNPTTPLPRHLLLTHLHEDHRRGLIPLINFLNYHRLPHTVWVPHGVKTALSDNYIFVTGSLYYPNLPHDFVPSLQEMATQEVLEMSDCTIVCINLKQGHIETQTAFLVLPMSSPRYQPVLAVGDSLKGLIDSRTPASCFPALLDTRPQLLEIATTHNALIFEGHGAFFHFASVTEIETQCTDSPQSPKDLPPGPFPGTYST